MLSQGQWWLSSIYDSSIIFSFCSFIDILFERVLFLYIQIKLGDSIAGISAFCVLDDRAIVAIFDISFVNDNIAYTMLQ